MIWFNGLKKIHVATLLYCPPRKSKREIKIKKTTSPKTPPTKKNQPAIHGLRKPGGQARKQKTMRSTTKLGTKNKPISFKIDFENFFAKTKIDRPPFICPPPYTDKKKEKKRILIKKKLKTKTDVTSGPAPQKSFIK